MEKVENKNPSVTVPRGSHSPQYSSVPPELSFEGGTLVLKHAFKPLVERLPETIVWHEDKRVGAWRCDALHYPALRQWLDTHASSIRDTVPGWQTVCWPKSDLHTLRPEQQQALSAWMPERQGLVVMPTGTGKTEVALAILHELSVSALVVAPVRDLMYQWHRRILARLGMDAGVIGDSLFRVSPVSVTTYDSACIHMDKLGARFGLIIFDECHHLAGNLRRDAARMSAAPFRLGLTATPERSDGRHADLAWLVGPTVYDMPIAAVKGTTLADYEVIRIPVHLSQDEQSRYDALSEELRQFVAERRKSDPDFSWQELCREVGRDAKARRAQRAYLMKKAIEDRAEEKLRVLEDIFRLHTGSRVLVFAGSNAMAREVSLRFLIPCLLSHCGRKERFDILEGFESGRYPAIVANQVLDEGVDVPEAKVAVVIGGHASTRQAKQRLGRILRRSGSEKATLYEVVCAETNEEERSRKRRSSDAYAHTRRGRL